MIEWATLNQIGGGGGILYQTIKQMLTHDDLIQSWVVLGFRCGHGSCVSS